MDYDKAEQAERERTTARLWLEHHVQQAAERRKSTRLWLCVWIAEMAFVSFFAARLLAMENTCGTQEPAEILLASNYFIPLFLVALFLVPALGSLLLGQPLAARESIGKLFGGILSCYKAAPTLTFIALGLLLWTTYNVQFRYRVQFDYQGSVSGDFTATRTVTDTLTGFTKRIVISGDDCTKQRA
ncbi:MAG TPA: hypothetical protein VGF98_01155 [Candidatus Tumulicola sp.]